MFDFSAYPQTYPHIAYSAAYELIFKNSMGRVLLLIDDSVQKLTWIF